MKKLYCCAAFWVLLSTLFLSPAFGLAKRREQTDKRLLGPPCHSPIAGYRILGLKGSMMFDCVC